MPKLLHPSLRAKAIELRTEKHLSIDEIAARLALSRSTVYYWVRDIPLGRKSRLNPHPGARISRDRARRARDEAYNVGILEFEELCLEPTFRDFVCMYIGEGYKRNRNVVALGNSDPAVVALANRWIERFARNKMAYSIQYHADQDLSDLRSFWSEHLEIPADSIRFQRKSNSSAMSQRKWRCRYGVLTVASSDTLLRARLQAWIDRTVATWT